jgi:hypothetical protein
MVLQRTPEQWRDLLHIELQKRRPEIQRLEDFYNGDHPLPSPPKRLSKSAFEQARRAYQELMEMGVTNWVKLVADAPSERLEVVDIRSVTEAGVQSEDRTGWGLWQRYDLDAQSILVQDNALQTGQSFVMVDPVSGEITAEHSAQMIVAYKPGSRREVEAALKWWDDDSGDWMATLLLPDAVHKWQGDVTKWMQRTDQPVVTHNLGVVSVVEFAANPSLRPALYGGGRSEFAGVLPIQRRINTTVFNRLTTADAQAFRQRYIIGWTPETDEETGLPKADAVRSLRESMLWTFDGDPGDVKVGEFAQAEFTGFIKAVESDVNAMAAISKTPPHYLLGAMVNISGDALTAAESGLTSKTKKHARNFGARWEDVMRLAAKVAGNPLGEDLAAEVVWADIEHRSWGEQVDAALKMKALGVPLEAIWERLPDVSPQDIVRWRGMTGIERLLNPSGDEDVVT